MFIFFLNYQNKWTWQEVQSEASSIATGFPATEGDPGHFDVIGCHDQDGIVGPESPPVQGGSHSVYSVVHFAVLDRPSVGCIRLNISSENQLLEQSEMWISSEI